jgi:hypothetical protein
MVRVGDQVEMGEQVGKMGSTGRSTGVHLHYELRRNGRPVDPMEAFQVAQLRSVEPPMPRPDSLFAGEPAGWSDFDLAKLDPFVLDDDLSDVGAWEIGSDGKVIPVGVEWLGDVTISTRNTSFTLAPPAEGSLGFGPLDESEAEAEAAGPPAE